MNTANESAFPGFVTNANGDTQGEFGMTKLEYFAVLALQGILANGTYDPPRRERTEGMAEDAVRAARALIAELEKVQP